MLMRRTSTYASRARGVAVPAHLTMGKRFASALVYASTAPSTSLRIKTQTAILPVYSVSRRYASSYPPHTKVGMPALSPTMTTGNIAQWNKKVGDRINSGDSIAEIETDKSTMAFESVDEGWLAKIIAPNGSKDVPVNKVIAVIADRKEDIAKFADYQDGAAAPSSSSSSPTPASKQQQKEQPKQQKEQPKQQQKTQSKPSTPAKSYPPHTVIGLPALSPTMAKGNIVGWRKKEGDMVNSGDIIAEIETDKSTMEFECIDEGYVAKILFPGKASDLDINTPIAILVPKKEDIEKFKDFKPQEKGAAAAETTEAPQQEEESRQEQPQQDNNNHKPRSKEEE